MAHVSRNRVHEGSHPERFGKTTDQLAFRGRLERCGVKKEIVADYRHAKGIGTCMMQGLKPTWRGRIVNGRMVWARVGEPTV